MKKIYFALLFICPLFSLAANYPGNGATGFGGGVGNSTLDITDNGTSIIFNLTAGGTGFSGNNLVIYIDNGTAGFSSTSTFTDNADGGRTAISGFSSNGRTLVNFPSGFTPSKAISLEYGFAGLFNLNPVNNFGFVSSGGLVVSGNQLSFSFLKDDLGLTSTTQFRFFATLISPSGYRSNETIGSAITDTPPPGDAPNFGFNGTINPASFATYGLTVLPLRLISFTGVAKNNMHELAWKSVAEANLQNYIVEQSFDNFSWKTVAQVAAKNNLSESNYVQQVAIVPSLVSYYRLRITEIDGKLSYSNIVALKNDAASHFGFRGNVVVGKLDLIVNEPLKTMINISIFSTDGKLVKNLQVNHQGGSANYELSTVDLRQGLYIARFSTKHAAVYSARFLKQ